jgi:hypothetical protein
MSRLTGSDALGLFEAYQSVYVPQEITEEQVWEEVEYWVNDLMREGYDLSDYTWEEMYESYVDEGRAPGVPKYSPGMGGVRRTGAEIRADAAAAAQRRAVVGANQPGYPDRTGKTEGPLITVNPGDPEDAARALGRTKPRPHSKTGNPARIMGGNIGRGSTRGGAATLDMIMGPQRNIPRANSLPDKGGKKPPSREVIRRNPQAESYDVYDLVLSHLLDEGYADTFESAEAIMVNMSEEWRDGIVSEMINNIPPKSPGKPGEKGSIPGSQEINKAKDPKKYMKKNAPY